MRSCSVIIVNYNAGELLSRAVSSVVSDETVDKVLIIDNNSRDQSMDLVAENPKIEKIYRKHNYGFASSCNYGARLCATEYLLFLNPDCILSEDSKLKHISNHLDEHKNAAITGCLINNPDGSEQRACRRRLPTFWRALKTFTGIEKLANYCNCFAGVNINHRSMVNKVTPVEAISGAFIFIRSSVFNQINGFDEEYPMHFEDLDLFKRTGDAGYKILFDPFISATHFQGESSKSNNRVSEYKKQGLRRYFHKHCSWLSSKLINLISRFL